MRWRAPGFSIELRQSTRGRAGRFWYRAGNSQPTVR
jgi:hypothetical protein